MPFIHIGKALKKSKDSKVLTNIHEKKNDLNISNNGDDNIKVFSNYGFKKITLISYQRV